MFDLEQSQCLAVGGIGGSGTRLVAQMIEALGYSIGRDLNESRDDLAFTFLFKDPSVLVATDQEFRARLHIFLKSLRGVRLTSDEIKVVQRIATVPRPHYDMCWLRARAEFLVDSPHEEGAQLRAWKEPNTHVFLPRLLECLPNLKYIHVVRSGFYMVHSQNQNQPRLWGPYLLGEPLDTPNGAIKWWCYVSERLRSYAINHPSRVFLLKFEDIVAKRAESFRAFLEFINIEATSDRISILASLVRPEIIRPMPPANGIQMFHLQDDQRVCLESFGYVEGLPVRVE